MPALLISCTKSGALTGSSSSGSSSFGTITGSANGGLSPLSGATVNLNLGGNPTPVASATTAADGSFSIVFNGQTSGNFLYLTITGGNAGNGTNSNNELMSIVGTSGAPLSSLHVNEMSTAATELVGMNMGLLNDSSGTITLSAPKNAAGASNVITQFQNIIANGNLNTSNSNLTTSAQNGLAVMANAFASCIENSSNCNKLFADATTSSGTNALTVLESGYYALLNSSNVASSLYALAFPFNSTTGFTLTSSNLPGGFTFNNPLPASVTTLTGLSQPQTMAFDASGNAWITTPGSSTVSKVSPSGSLLGTFTTASNPLGIAIDPNGNVWVNASGHVNELNSSGTLIGTFSGQANGTGIAIDTSGNVYVGTQTTTTMMKLSASGTVLKTITTAGKPRGIVIDGSGFLWVTQYSSQNLLKMDNQLNVINTISLPATDPGSIQMDPSGNFWIGSDNSTTFTRVTPSGTTSGITLGGEGFQSAIDQNGNIWVITGLATSSGFYELNTSGTILAHYAFNGFGRGLAIDPSGNVWVDAHNTNVQIFNGLTIGANLFPYSGPQCPFSNI